MCLFKKKDKPPKNADSVEFKRWMTKRLDGRTVKYVMERTSNGDRMIGKSGFLSTYGDEFSVICGEKTLFRTKIDELSACWEFMSLEGIYLTGKDLTNDGKERTVMAYYTYYLKMPEHR